MFDRLDDTLMRYEEMMNQLSEPDVANDPERFKRLMKEQSRPNSRSLRLIRNTSSANRQCRG